MCKINAQCTHTFYTDACNTCCIEAIEECNISLSVLKSLKWLYKQLNRDAPEDARVCVLSAYILVPSLFHESARELFLSHFKNMRVNTESLEKGKWLDFDININKKLIESLFVTQKIKFDYEKVYYDALDYFTDRNNNIHRNKVAHRASLSIAFAAKVTARDILKQYVTLLHCLINFHLHIISSLPQKHPRKQRGKKKKSRT